MAASRGKNDVWNSSIPQLGRGHCMARKFMAFHLSAVSGRLVKLGQVTRHPGEVLPCWAYAWPSGWQERVSAGDVPQILRAPPEATKYFPKWFVHVCFIVT